MNNHTVLPRPAILVHCHLTAAFRVFRHFICGNAIFGLAVCGLQSCGLGGLSLQAAESDGSEFFETRIRPVLVEHCYECHSSKTSNGGKGGLRVDTRQAIRAGGESGHAVVPNDVDESLLLRALRYEDFEMPPSGRLSDTIVADFEAWIRMGAPDPRVDASSDVAALAGSASDASARESSAQVTGSETSGHDDWAYQRPQASQPPTDLTGWSYNDIDRFLAARHREHGLQPAPDAERSALLRRVYFDLIGLPPTADEIRAFVRDRSPGVFEAVVDRLLASPEFGQRWGRHWLDLVRYAESTGRTRNFPYPFAWRYRDYVIASFNADKPYDRFLQEQIAGDLLPASDDAARRQQRIATGFLTLGAYDLNERNRAIYQMDQVGDQLDVIGRAVMGLTLGCARCHDHKFDPIPTRDYYAMAGILRNTEVLNGYTNRRRANQIRDLALYVDLDDLRSSDDLLTAALNSDSTTTGSAATNPINRVADNDAIEAEEDVEAAQVAFELNEPSDDATRQSNRTTIVPSDAQERSAARRRKQVEQRQTNQRRQAAQTRPLEGPYAMGVRDRQRITDCPIHLGGDVDRLGEKVPRGFLQVIDVTPPPEFSDAESGRVQLADWLTRADHPLTPRVLVNRVWHHLFGRGIVATVDNFGAMGSEPSHPELLDTLAVEFVAEGWSIKTLIRKIVLSHAYQLSHVASDAQLERDADNQWLWRMPLRRLEAEAIRDALLSVSGRLQSGPPANSVVQQLPIRQLGRNSQLLQRLDNYPFRSVYVPIIRGQIPDYLQAFDFPEPSEVKGDRESTTVATQALFMMNSPLVQQQCEVAAARLLQTHPQATPRRLVREAYLLTLNRWPTEPQIARAMDYARQVRQAFDPATDGTRARRTGPRLVMHQVMTDLIHALVASAEFRYR